MKPRTRSQGFAAILAIAVAGAVASVASYLIWDATLGVRQLENLRAAHQADLAVRAAVKWASTALAQDDPRIDHRAEPWARPLTGLDIEGVEIRGVLSDEQAKFNINNLADGNERSEAHISAFKRILARAGLPESLADAVVDWLDGDDVVTGPGGAEDLHYLGLEPPYRTAGREISDVAELVLLKGFTDASVRRLAPYVTALPGANRVNINTTSPELLAALLPGVAEGDAKALLAARGKQPFRSIDELLQRLPQSAAAVAGQLCDVRSQYFLARGTVRVGRVDSTFDALLTRKSLAILRLTKGFG